MPSRDRYRTRTVASDGVAIAINSSLTDQHFGPTTVFEEIIDFVGNRGGDNPLLHWREASCGALISGVIPGYWDCRNIPFPNSHVGWTDFWQQYPKVPPASDNHLFLQGKAQGNPNRPSVDLPVFLFELRDIPGMIKDWGDDIKRAGRISGGQYLTESPAAVAKRYVEYQFGIKPVIDDVKKMLDFQKSVERKLKAVENLSKRGVENSNNTVYEDERTTHEGVSLLSALYMESRTARTKTTINRKYWTSTRWEATGDIPRTSEDKYQLAVRLAYGLDISFATMWEAMPWSWLIDWFSDIGLAMQQTRGTIPVRAARQCLMKKTWISMNIMEVYSEFPVTVTPIPEQSVHRERVLAGPVLNVDWNLPFLTGSQAAILSSLAVLKGQRR